MTDTPFLSLDSLAVSYGRKQVFSGIDLTLNEGEVFGLIGVNGAGKTSLIRSFLGLLPAKGNIRLFGRLPSDTQARADLCYLPEKFLPADQLTGWEYIKLTLSYYGQAVDKNAVLDLAEKVAFPEEAIDRRIRTYSKGMAQKIGLIGALLPERSFLVLDEPMSGLDPASRVRLKECLLAYRKAGRSLFLSSHILADMEELCSRIAILHNGKILFDGMPNVFMKKWQAATLERAFLACVEQEKAG